MARVAQPRETSCTEKDLSGEILRHRVLSAETEPRRTSRTNSFCLLAGESCNGICTLSSSNVRAHGHADARASRKRGWKIKGQLAGEWQDRFGRRRRARPTEIGNDGEIIVPAAAGPAGAAEISMVSSIPGSSSCAGTKVSFEGLVDELRERLPRASLLAKYVAEQQDDNHPGYPLADAVVSGTTTTIDRHEEGMALDHGKGEEGGGCSFGKSGRSVAGANEVTRLRGNSRIEERRGGRGGAAGLMPPGCLRLRHPVLGTIRALTTSPPLTSMVPTGNNTNINPRLSSSAGIGQNRSVRQATESRLFPDESSYRLPTTGAPTGAVRNNTSPSAEMVAAAKAYERALPMLQVCAVRIAEPAGC